RTRPSASRSTWLLSASVSIEPSTLPRASRISSVVAIGALARSIPERGGDRARERAQAERNVVASPVDEDARGRGHAAQPAAVDSLAHALQVQLVAHLRIVPLHVELQPLRVRAQLPEREMGLVLEEQIVHLPELFLCAGSFGRQRGVERVRVYFLQGEV